MRAYHYWMNWNGTLLRWDEAVIYWSATNWPSFRRACNKMKNEKNGNTDRQDISDATVVRHKYQILRIFFSTVTLVISFRVLFKPFFSQYLRSVNERWCLFNKVQNLLKYHRQFFCMRISMHLVIITTRHSDKPSRTRFTSKLTSRLFPMRSGHEKSGNIKYLIKCQ